MAKTPVKPAKKAAPKTKAVGTERKGKTRSAKFLDYRPAYDEYWFGMPYVVAVLSPPSDDPRAKQLYEDVNDSRAVPWILACMNGDRDGGTLEHILPLIIDAAPAAARRCIEDFFARHQPTLRKKWGKQATPYWHAAYDTESRVSQAAQEVKDRGEYGEEMSRDDAIEQAAKRHLIEPETLRTALEGRRGSAKRRRG